MTDRELTFREQIGRSSCVLSQRPGMGVMASPRGGTASLSRFRPILLTTLTTFLGLTPILLERSSYAQDLKPMAIALAFGELTSTAIILLLVPAAYVAWEGRRRAPAVSAWTVPPAAVPAGNLSTEVGVVDGCQPRAGGPSRPGSPPWRADGESRNRAWSGWWDSNPRR